VCVCLRVLCNYLFIALFKANFVFSSLPHDFRINNINISFLCVLYYINRVVIIYLYFLVSFIFCALTHTHTSIFDTKLSLVQILFVLYNLVNFKWHTKMNKATRTHTHRPATKPSFFSHALREFVKRLWLSLEIKRQVKIVRIMGKCQCVTFFSRRCCSSSNGLICSVFWFESLWNKKFCKLIES
jgi:hypothetical protein